MTSMTLFRTPSCPKCGSDETQQGLPRRPHMPDEEQWPAPLRPPQLVRDRRCARCGLVFVEGVQFD